MNRSWQIAIGRLSLALTLALWAGRLSAAPLSGGYMAKGNDWLCYLHLTQVGHELKGYAQDVFADDGALVGFATRRSEVTGSVTGTTLVLNLDSFFGYMGDEWDATLGKSRLTVTFPTNSGRIQTLSFRQTSASTWNTLVSALEKRRTHVMELRRAQAARAQVVQLLSQDRQQQMDDLLSEWALAISGATAARKAEKLLSAARPRLDDANEALKRANEVESEAKARAQDAQATAARTQAEADFHAADAAFRAVDKAATAASNSFTKQADARAAVDEAEWNRKNAQDQIARARAAISDAEARIDRDEGQLNNCGVSIANPCKLGFADFLHPTCVVAAIAKRNGVPLLRRSGTDSVQTVAVCHAGQSVPLAGRIGDWYCALLQDGSIAFVHPEDVAVPAPHPNIGLRHTYKRSR